MTFWLKLLFWGALALDLVGMAVLSAESLPPASAVQQTGVAAPPDWWTLPPGCVSR